MKKECIDTSNGENPTFASNPGRRVVRRCQPVGRPLRTPNSGALRSVVRYSCAFVYVTSNPALSFTRLRRSTLTPPPPAHHLILNQRHISTRSCFNQPKGTVTEMLGCCSMECSLRMRKAMKIGGRQRYNALRYYFH